MIDWVALRWRWRCVELRWGEVSEWEGESERANEWLWCMGAENDHFVNVRSSLDRMLTAQFDRLEVSLAWNCIEYVFADQLSSAIVHHDLIWYDMIWFQVWIWFEDPYVCTSHVCHFNDNTLPAFFSSMIACDYSLFCRSNIRMSIVYQRRLRKSFYTTQCTTKFLMFHI